MAMWERHTYLRCVVCSAEDQFWCPVVSGADVRHIRLVLHKNLGASEIAQLQYASVRVEEEILRLDISVADSLGVDVGKRAEKLIDVELDLENGHDGLQFVEIP